MKRYCGTVVRGLRAPIFNAGDRLEEMVPELLMEASQNSPFPIKDRDVLCITESVIARAQGNYASVEDITLDLKSKLPSDCKKLGLVFPILSRNRFSILLKGMAAACSEIVLLLSYPSDEVGNALFDENALSDTTVNPWQDVLSEDEFHRHFGESVHPFTGINYVSFYRSLIEESGAKCTILFANRPDAILACTKHVVCCDIHTRARSKAALRKAGASWVITMDEILNTASREHGYNEQYGLLGSNKAEENKVKLFPRDCQGLVESIAERVYQLSGKKVEVMVYGDGAFKDPVGKIWELADPVVSPAHTAGLIGTPNELKLKYLADNDFKGMSADEQRESIESRIRAKEGSLVGNMVAEGTTPRHLTDLLGSLADLTSGSGDKGTPIVYVQGYFDNFADA